MVYGGIRWYTVVYCGRAVPGLAGTAALRSGCFRSVGMKPTRLSTSTSSSPDGHTHTRTHTHTHTHTREREREREGERERERESFYLLPKVKV